MASATLPPVSVATLLKLGRVSNLPEILTAAFDDAWTGVQASQAPFAAEDYASAAREILAKHIIMAAQRGERDRRRLTDSALLHLSQQKLSKKPPAL